MQEEEQAAEDLHGHCTNNANIVHGSSSLWDILLLLREDAA